MTKYGFIQDTEGTLLDELMVTLKQEFGAVRFLEIGVFAGQTTTGVVNRCKEIDCPLTAAGVDFIQWKPATDPVPGYQFYEGDSMDAWRQIQPGFNLLFIDGCHCVNHSMMDFLNYSPLLDVGGFCLFHDTAFPPTDAPPGYGAWPQDHSYAGKPPSYLGVREGLIKLGLLGNLRSDWQFVREVEGYGGLMGLCCFRRVLPY